MKMQDSISTELYAVLKYTRLLMFSSTTEKKKNACFNLEEDSLPSSRVNSATIYSISYSDRKVLVIFLLL